MMASLAADFVSKHFFGLGTVFSFGVPSVLPLNLYGHLLLLGLLCGAGGALFCRVILDVQTLYGRLPFPARYRVVIPALAALCIGPFLPDILGGGHALVSISAWEGRPCPSSFSSSRASCSSRPSASVSGRRGIFLPMLAVGASLGALYGTVRPCSREWTRPSW